MSSTVDMVTLTEVKNALEITGTGRDTALSAAITAASRAINRKLGRELTPRTDTATRTVEVDVNATPRDGGLLVDLRPYDIRSLTTATLHPEDATASTVLVADTDYALWPFGGSTVTGTYTRLILARTCAPLASTYSTRFGVVQLQILGNWGAWNTTDVPEDIKRACIITVGSWTDKAIAEYGDQFGDEARSLQRPVFEGFAVPRSALNLLQSAGLTSFPVFA
jgi:hypothetical protein